MNLAVLRWLRLVAPPSWAIVTLLLACGMTEALYAWIGWSWGWQAVFPEFFRVRDIACLAAAAFLGNYRISSFHPQFDHEYLSWLWLTPWKHDKPLPRGPLHLVLQDVLMLAVIAALMLHHPNVPLLLVPLVFLLSYYAALAVSLWTVDLRQSAYALFALIGLVMVVAYQSLEAAMGVAALIYGPAYACIRWTLKTFPWSARANALRKGFARQWQIFTAGHRQFGSVSANLDFPETEVHWPFNLLHARQRPAFFERGDCVAVALLIGWWTWVVCSAPVAGIVAVHVASSLYVMLVGFVVSARLLAYCANYRPPISFWGRIFTLRWVIPRYDVVFLTPLATLALAIGVPIWLRRLQLDPPLVLSLSIPPFLIMAMLGGPRLARWRLTSPARLTPGIRNQQLVEEI